MQLSTNFSLTEFTDTSHRNIDNSLPTELFKNAVMTATMLEKIRAFLTSHYGREVPISLSSGYRCRELNTVVGGSANSDHMLALSADWNARKFGTPYEICKLLEPMVNDLGIGQLIHEYGRWIHTSARIPDKAINRILTYSKSGKVPGIHKV